MNSYNRGSSCNTGFGTMNKPMQATKTVYVAVPSKTTVTSSSENNGVVGVKRKRGAHRVYKGVAKRAKSSSTRKRSRKTKKRKTSKKHRRSKKRRSSKKSRVINF